MTIAGTAFKSCAPCKGCGAEGEQVWLEAVTELCHECRKVNTSMSTEIVKYEDELKPHTTAIAEFLSAEARGYELQTQGDFDEAAGIINELKDRAKQLETIEKSATRPALAGVEVIRSWFRPVRAAAAEARTIWDAKIIRYLTKQEQAQQEVQRKLEASVAAGDKVATTAALAKLEATPVAAGASVVRTVGWEVINLELVPVDFICVDDGAVKSVCTGAKELPVVPGIRFFWKQSVRAVR